jgi:hypothetical protein
VTLNTSTNQKVNTSSSKIKIKFGTVYEQSVLCLGKSVKVFVMDLKDAQLDQKVAAFFKLIIINLKN